MLSRYLMTKEQLQAIGMLTIEATYVETYLDAAIRWITHLDLPVLDILAPPTLMISAKLKLLNELVRVKTPRPEILAAWRKIYDEISDLIPKRNTVIHGDWSDGLTLGDLSSAHKKNNAIAYRRGVANPVQADEILKLAERFSVVILELSEFFVSQEKELGLPVGDE
jgi:hypothetical protein